VATEIWRHYQDDPHDSGWWQIVRLLRRDDGRLEIETNTRSSVVPTTIVLDDLAVQRLRRALGDSRAT
jgi:hypothetical protein